MAKGGPSGGIFGILKNIIVFIINYGYIPLQWFLKKSDDKQPMDVSVLQIRPNRLIVLTGATGGLGSSLLKKLLETDADVVVGVRNPEEMKSILLEARENTSSGNLTSLRLDLTSLESVRNFAAEVTKENKPIGVLINAAGIQGGSYELTRDGNEKQFQVNYLGHFLLSNLLIPRMTLTSTEVEPALILNLSSIVESHGKLDLQNLNSQKWYNAAQAFYNSKLCIAASTHFLGLRLKQKGIQTRVNAIHPGFLETKQWDNYCIGFLQNFWKKKLLPATTGAEDVLYVAFHPDTEGITGSFYINQTVDPEIPKLKWKQLEDLWNISCELAKIPNIYSLAPPLVSDQNQKLNNEVLVDLEVENGKTGNKNKFYNKNNRTMSVITINNLDNNGRRESVVLKRELSQVFSLSSSTVAVAPLEADLSESGLSNVAVLAPVVGIKASDNFMIDNVSNIQV